jgi:ABC-type glycerol-3-phosphate transport system substrate-binding protein
LAHRVEIPSTRRVKSVIRKRTPALAGVLLVACLALAACGSSSKSSSGSPTASSGGSHTLQLWLGGDLTQATPGSPFLAWVNQQISRFEKQNPGWKIQTSLLPFDNGENAAKLEAAFASKGVPDIMNLYSGQFTNAYTKALMPLNTYVNQTPGLYSSIPEPVWNIECVSYECNGGKNPILGIPWNSGAYYLFYNKALLSKAGISSPPATYTELFADCTKSGPRASCRFRWEPRMATTHRTCSPRTSSRPSGRVTCRHYCPGSSPTTARVWSRP